MAGRPIEIIVDANVKGVEDGAKDIADSLEKVEDALDDVQDKAKDTGKYLENSISDGVKDGSKDASNSLEKVEKSLDNAGNKGKELDRDLTRALDDVADKAKSTGNAIDRGIGDGARKGTDAAKAGLDEFKGEANSTARESAASFDGSAESIADVFQEVAANAFAGFGPAGAAAGLAVAVGFGAAIAKAQELAEANNEAKTSAAELGDELYEAGGKLDKAGLSDKIREIMFALSTEDNPWTVWADEASTGIEDVKKAIEGVEGISDKDVFEGLAGDLEAGIRSFDDLTESIDRDKDALLGMTETLGDHSVQLTTEGRQLEDNIAAREELVKKIEEATGATANATALNEYFTEVMGKSTEAQEAEAEAAEGATEATDAQAEAADRAAEAILAKAEALDRSANANMGAEQAELKYVETLGAASETIATNGRTLDINTEAGRANRGALLDLADSSNSLIQKLIEQGGSTADVTARTENARSAFIAAAESAGYTGEQARALAGKYGLIPKNVDTRVQAHNVAQTEAEINGVARPRDAAVNVKVGTDEVTNYINGMNGKRVYVNVVPHGGGRGITD